MNAILTSLIHLAQRTGLFTVEEATAVYNGLWRKLFYALAACAVAFFLNATFGWKVPSLLLALVFAIVAFYVWAKPLHVLGIAGTGLVAKIVTHKDIATEVKKVLELYLEFLKWVLIVGGVFLLTTGTFSFQGSPVAGLSLLVSLGVVGLFIWKWPNVFVGTWGRRFFYTSALLIAVFSFVSIIPGPVWVKYMPYGWDPSTAKPTSTEEGLYRLNKIRREMADADRAAEISRIAGKVERREALTQAEERFIADSQSASQPQQAQLQQRGADCTYARPCPPALETTQVPEGSRVCFDPPVFANLEGFGIMVSSRGVAEHRYACTLEEVVNGTCKEKPFEKFRFSPTNGVTPPRHWFTKDSGIVC